MATIAYRSAAVCIGGAGAVIAGCGAWLNYYGAKVMAPGEAAEILAVGAVASEIIKLAWLSGFRILLRQWMWGSALAVLAGGILLHAFSLTAALGTSAAGRDKSVSGREGQQNSLASAQAAVAAAKADVERVAGTRSEITVQQDIDRLLLIPGTNGCTAPKGWDAMQTCKQVQTLRAEIVQARKADELRSNLRTVEGKVEALTFTVPHSADPQAEAIATYLPVSATTIGKALPLLPSVLVEFTPMIAMLLATILWSGVAEPKPMPSAQEVRAEPAGDASPMRKALERVTALVLNSEDDQLTVSQRQLADIFGVPKSTLADWVQRWIADGQIEADTSGQKTVFRLPKPQAVS